MTGFSVAWGIFMLIILLGSGNGLMNGVSSNFSSRATNSMTISAGETSIAYKGYQAGRRIKMYLSDVEALKNQNPEINLISTEFHKWGEQLSTGKEYMDVILSGVSPDFLTIQGVKTLSGRAINNSDLSELRKVVMIDEAAEKTLFKGKNPVGQKVNIRNSAYTVIGVCKTNEWNNNSKCFLPLTTVNGIFYGNDPDVYDISFTADGLDTRQKNEEFEKRIRTQLAARHDFSPKDEKAVWIDNNQEDYLTTMMVFGGISMFIWVIGIGTLMAGIVGVSNIMLVTVRERTYEFGIRKALGARPGSIVSLILIESVAITAFFGYIGMVLGIGIMEVVNIFIERAAAASASEFRVFMNPTVNLSIAVSATVVLVVAGLIAGYVPARRAARIKTIDALRFNK